MVALADRQYDWKREHSQGLTYDMLSLRGPKRRREEVLKLTSDSDE